MDYLFYLINRLGNIVDLNEGLTLLAVTLMGVGGAPLLQRGQRDEIIAWLRQYASMLPTNSVLLLLLGLALLYVL